MQLHDGSKRELWCTFGPQQIDINVFTPQGARPSLHCPPLQNDHEPAGHPLFVSDLYRSLRSTHLTVLAGIPIRSR